MDILHWSLLFTLLALTQAKTETRIGPDGEEQIVVTSPELSEEEQDSPHMPDDHICDGCKAVAFQYHKNFQAAEKKFQGSTGKPLGEADLIEAAEETCEPSVYENYKIIDIGGKNFLNGEGIVKMSKGGAISVVGGGRWPSRMAQLCGQFMEDIGEDVIYKEFRKVKADLKMFTKYLCDKPKYCKKGTKDEL